MLEDRGSHIYTACLVKRNERGEHYAMVRAQFVWRFEQAAASPIDVAVDSTFILYIKDGVAKIVFQHEHEDFWQALRTRGVLPSQG